jgi:uncharacterized protein with GYD domain
LQLSEVVTIACRLDRETKPAAYSDYPFQIHRRPQDRAQALKSVVEKLGGQIERAWFCFGEYDSVVILRMPDNVSVGAFSVAATTGGTVKAVKTTPLMSLEEGMDMLKKEAASGYKPPQ